MNTYFVVSDIHSYAGYLETALKKSGFKKTNKEHILIVNGDLFDRGYDSVGVYNFIRTIPKARRVLIKGNHEQLYLNLLKKEYPEDYDFLNGTVRTFCDIADMPELSRYDKYFLSDNDRTYLDVWKEIRTKVQSHPITR